MSYNQAKTGVPNPQTQLSTPKCHIIRELFSEFLDHEKSTSWFMRILCTQ